MVIVDLGGRVGGLDDKIAEEGTVMDRLLVAAGLAWVVKLRWVVILSDGKVIWLLILLKMWWLDTRQGRCMDRDILVFVATTFCINRLASEWCVWESLNPTFCM